MAFGFFKKKADGTVEDAPPREEPQATTAQPDPEKARRFFDRAQGVHDSTNYEYAMTLWLQGLRMDPSSITGIEAFMRSAQDFMNSPARPKGPTKDQLGNFTGRAPIDKYLLALLNWGTRQLDWAAGLKAFELAVKLELTEHAAWIGRRVLGIAGEDPRAKKDTFVTLMNLFEQIRLYEPAVVAGEIATRLDPTDSRLAAEVKNLAARSTMQKSGYEEGSKVEAGAFRRNVKDIQGQRAQEEEERIVKTEEVQNRAIERALADYKERPTDIGAIKKLARLLKERGTFEDEKLAYEILMKGYADTQNHLFKEEAGDINLRVARRQVRAIKKAAADDPASEEKKQAAARAERQLLEMEVAEYQERTANNPTDLHLRYELGKRLLSMGEDERAIEQLQQARGAPGAETNVMWGLAQAFMRLGWLDEAESSYREAIASHPVQNDELSAELRYGLMSVLRRKAEDSRQLALAEEAFKLASGIAIQRINFRDIREQRSQLQELVKTLRG